MNSNAEINHSLLFYYEVCRLRKFGEYYESTVESIVEEFEYIEEGKSNIFSKETSNIFKFLRGKIIDYYKNVPFSDDSILMQIDPSFREILNQYQWPLLKSMEKDLSTNGIKYEECSRQEIDRPSDKEIIDRIYSIYKQFS